MTAGVGMTRHDICMRQYLSMPHLLSPIIILNYYFLKHAEETKSCYPPLVLLITTHICSACSWCYTRGHQCSADSMPLRVVHCSAVTYVFKLLHCNVIQKLFLTILNFSLSLSLSISLTHLPIESISSMNTMQGAGRKKRVNGGENGLK